MSTRLYVVPTKRITLTKEEDYRLNALAAGTVRGFMKNIGSWEAEPGLGPKPLSYTEQRETVKRYLSTGRAIQSQDIRAWRNIDDAGTALDRWLTAALAAVDTEYSCLQAVAAAPAANRLNKLVVFYKVTLGQGAGMIPIPVTRLIFRRTNAAGIIMAQYDLEALDAQEIQEGYLTEPVVWDPGQPYAVNVLSRIATGLVEPIILGAFVFETAGQTSA